MSNEEKLIDKIAKLLKVAESKKHAASKETDKQTIDRLLEEADSFSAHATRLLLEHNIEMMKVRQKMGEEAISADEQIGVYAERISYSENLAGDRWLKDLIKVIVKHNLCGVIFAVPPTNTPAKFAKDHKTFKVYGSIQNVDVSVWLFNWLKENLMVLAKQYRLSLPPDEFAKYCRHTILKDFLTGAIVGLDDRLTDQAEEMASQQAFGALIKYNAEALDKFLKEKFPHSYKSNPASKKIHTPGALEAGYAAGQTVDLGTDKKLTAAQKKLNNKLLGNK